MSSKLHNLFMNSDEKYNSMDSVDGKQTSYKISYQQSVNPHLLDTIMMNARDMKHATIHIGQPVLLMNDPLYFYGTIWPSKDVPAKTLFLNKSCSPHFDKISSLTIIPLHPSDVFIDVLTRISLSYVNAKDSLISIPEPHLRIYIPPGSSVSPNQIVLIPYMGKSILLQIHLDEKISLENHTHDENFNSRRKFHRITKETKFNIISTKLTTDMNDSDKGKSLNQLYIFPHAYIKEIQYAQQLIRKVIMTQQQPSPSSTLSSNTVNNNYSDSHNTHNSIGNTDIPFNFLLQEITQASKGLLIYGASGVGKTTFMKYVAYKSSCSENIYEISPGILIQKYQGEAESKLMKIVTEAMINSPSILLFDDFDLIAPSRSSYTGAAASSSSSNSSSGMNSETQNKIVSCLLRLIDELKKYPVFILATSSRPNNIDKAMRRPGRFDKEIELSVPSEEQRERIVADLLEQHECHILDPLYTINPIMNNTQRYDPDLAASDQKANSSNAVDDLNHRQIMLRQAISRKVARISHGMVASDLLDVLKEAYFLYTSQHSSIATLNTVFNTPSSSSHANYADTGAESITHHNLNRTNQSIPEKYILDAVKHVSPSALKEVIIEVPTVYWKDIGGMDTVKNSLKEVVEWPLQYPELFQSIGVSPPRGVLLYGPPGCSKTLMAKALATETSMNFLAVRGPELLSKWLGESEKAVQALFKRARSVAPCIIFFDEIDAFASKRGESSAGVNDRVLSQMLTELDGVQELKQVIVVAATNRPDLLDVALLRPGRIDRKVYVHPPDEISREQIFSIELRKTCVIPTEIDPIMPWLVEHSRGFSGAEIVSCVQQAIMSSIDDDLHHVSPVHLQSAVSQIKPQITTEMINFYTHMSSIL